MTILDERKLKLLNLEQIEDDKLYSVNELAPLLNVSKTTIYYWLKKQWIDYIRVGAKYKVSGEDVKKFVLEK